jgi:hypothetical protein
MTPRQKLGRPPLWLGFLWGVAEGTFFFIIPDVILGWASLSGARNGLRTLCVIVAGSLVAGVLMYTCASSQPTSSRAVVASVPFVTPRMFERVQSDYLKHGAAGMLRGPGSGIPYKVYAVLAPPFLPLATFVLMNIPARIERLALSWLVFTILGRIFAGWLTKHSKRAGVLFVAFWIVTYAIYWVRICVI